jgi:hypothetical protein
MNYEHFKKLDLANFFLNVLDKASKAQSKTTISFST